MRNVYTSVEPRQLLQNKGESTTRYVELFIIARILRIAAGDAFARHNSTEYGDARQQIGLRYAVASVTLSTPYTRRRVTNRHLQQARHAMPRHRHVTVAANVVLRTPPVV